MNLRRVFTEPREMDPILWVQGTAAAPYLEAGTVTKPEVWTRLLRVFRGEFIGLRDLVQLTPAPSRGGGSLPASRIRVSGSDLEPPRQAKIRSAGVPGREAALEGTPNEFVQGEKAGGGRDR